MATVYLHSYTGIITGENTIRLCRCAETRYLEWSSSVEYSDLRHYSDYCAVVVVVVVVVVVACLELSSSAAAAFPHLRPDTDLTSSKVLLNEFGGSVTLGWQLFSVNIRPVIPESNLYN